MIDLESAFIKKPILNEQEPSVDTIHDSVELERLAEHLNYCRQKQTTITYLEAANAIDIQAPRRIHRITELLEALLEHDHKHEQALRAAIVVSRTRTGIPGNGFFLKAQALGLMCGISASEFHQQCLNRLFDGHLEF